MKARTCSTITGLLVLFLLFTKSSLAQPQGRVVINEYMTWTSNGCGTKSEFVELLNFGPGAVNIGCYILTTGVYSVTIPPNTIIKPGEFYVLAGQDFIPGNCANIDSSATGVHANLNWNTCNCTNLPIPQTGDGMLSDGGTANTPLVLLDPSLNIVDAVVRNTPTEAVGQITSATLPGGCPGQTFNIGTMNPNYEILGMSAGRANSFARMMDGDCEWEKDPQQSANASNNRTGETTNITYRFDMINPTSCHGVPSGSASIYVQYSDYAAIFPMTYTLAMDMNNDGEFDENDQYTTGTDNTAPYIEMNSLTVGRYRLTVASSKGCFLKSFDFTIIPCNPGPLPVSLLYFKNTGSYDSRYLLEWLLQDVQNLQSIVVEKGDKDGHYLPEQVIAGQPQRGTRLYSVAVSADAANSYYRLKIVQKNGQSYYSPVLNLSNGSPASFNRIGPNPAIDKLNLQLNSPSGQKVAYTIYNSNGQAVSRSFLQLQSGVNMAVIPIQTLLPGAYHLQVTGLPGEKQPISFRFVKH